MRRKIACFLICLLFVHPSGGFPEERFPLSEDDRSLLDQIERDTFQYFLAHTDPETGLTRDSSSAGAPASIAATGFALAGFAIATAKGWISYRDAYQKIMTALTTLEKNEAGKNGFFYHFLDARTGKRTWDSEISSIDTALLMAGALTAQTYFKGTEMDRRITELYERVDWNWMRNGSLFFSHGWRPKEGFLPYYWDRYSEHLILLLLALGSEIYPVPAEMWPAWDRTSEPFNGAEIINSYTGSLFTYQYTHAFIDFRGLNDRGIDYFENSRKATLANQEFCAIHAPEFKTYQPNVWGLSASLGPDGYKPYGAEPGIALHDGTIAIYGPIASIVFTPEASIAFVKQLYEARSSELYGRFGFVDSFNQDRDWQAHDYLGIDQGIIVVMLENFLNNGAVWKRFMRLPQIRRGLERAGLTAD